MNTCLQAENSSLSSYMEDKVNEDVHFMKKKRYVKDSRLTEGAQLKPEQCPVVFSSGYDISCLGLERLHPFDARKWGNIHNRLLESGKLSSKASVIPKEASNHDLNVVHTEKYLHSLKNSVNVARIVEVPIVALIPHCFYDCKLLRPMRLQTGGTVLAAELALKNNWAINIGGGFHHASSSHGGGFCVYADISLALQFLFLKKMISRAMIVDLDAHQGNGHENDFRGDARVYIFDMFNCEIYPRDGKAEDGINRSVKLICGGQDEEYLRQLSSNLKAAFEEFTPDLVIYNAGTDCLVGDPLGLLNISADGILKRDEMVFVMSRERSIPIAMVTSGGYLRESAKIVADSILNLHEKELHVRNFYCTSKQQISKSRYKLIVLNNRDEEFDRPTSKLSWENGILAGRDEEAKEKGTWFGVNQHGGAGILLSITEPRYLHNAAPSRGLIVPEFLQSNSSLAEYSSDLATKAKSFNGFQFWVLKDKNGVYQLASLTNRLVPEVEPVYWPNGVYGFGNSPRSCPFKKVVHGEKLFQNALDSVDLEKCCEQELIGELLKIGTDDTLLFPDEQVREQTVAKYDEGYKYLCSLFVRFPDRRHGTRSHSILLVDKDDKATFFEKRMVTFPDNIENAVWETTIEKFQIIN